MGSKSSVVFHYLSGFQKLSINQTSRGISQITGVTNERVRQMSCSTQRLTREMRWEAAGITHLVSGCGSGRNATDLRLKARNVS